MDTFIMLKALPHTNIISQVKVPFIAPDISTLTSSDLLWPQGKQQPSHGLIT
jgi:hypothetical protein